MVTVEVDTQEGVVIEVGVVEEDTISREMAIKGTMEEVGVAGQELEEGDMAAATAMVLREVMYLPILLGPLTVLLATGGRSNYRNAGYTQSRGGNPKQ